MKAISEKFELKPEVKWESNEDNGVFGRVQGRIMPPDIFCGTF
jgi:hypothetical protein